MDKLQKVLNEVERLQNELIQEKKKGNGSDVDDACILELQNIKNYIKFVQEEPVEKDFEKALASEWKGYIDRGAATVDALEDNTQELAFAKGFYRGANWQKGQMIKNAIDGLYIKRNRYTKKNVVSEIDRTHDVFQKFKDGDKVKVIVIKED